MIRANRTTRAYLLVTVTLTPLALASEPSTSASESLSNRVAELVEGLNADRAAERRQAEDSLYELAMGPSGSGEAVLNALPPTNDRMPPSVRSGIQRIRRRVELTLAERAAEATRVTLNAEKMPLAQVLRAVGEQTGNQLAESSGRNSPRMLNRVTLRLENEPFWPAIDKIMDAARTNIYPYGGGSELSVVQREDSQSDRFGRAAYSGPFRFETLRVVATRGVRTPTEASLDVDIEIAWEPRLQPIALSQPMDEVRVVAKSGAPLSVRQPERSIDVEVTPGTQAIEITLPLILPSRSAVAIASLRGKIDALVPGRQADFRFEAVGATDRPIRQQQGDATVSLERFKRNGPVWELHMRLKMDQAGDAFASHRGWVFQNLSYLTDADGARIEHAGFETILQSANEVGLVYLFDLSDLEALSAAGDPPSDPRRLTWVYRTPVSIVSLPVEYQLGEVLLP
ncbi:hypothetical protein [Botrimarina hoheduenensis]|uniref:Bacterial type II and III secretion system protein n=1 Tax=Botrimarina hoheduenensis TaxID=2528000 RepID=A0A5C5WC18_9BACT|nr:hypothetical protein [Botrimarina hoheduenensis]TWT47655.1 hypothetical protein Pla111_12730 [Botrimarina hoheduenensis]